MAEFPAALGDMPLAEWASAINTRRSVRTYKERRVDTASLEGLKTFCAALPGHKAARVVVLEEAPSDLFTGLVLGSYGRVMGAPSAFLILGRPAVRGFQESVGYLGEAALLQATVMSLGTCWIAGSFDRDVASRLVGVEPGEEVLAVSPLGYAQERPRAGEVLMKAMVRAKHRRPVREIAPGFDEERWPAWAAEGVRLARLAPSAVNRQPWRFELGEGAVTISVVERGAEGATPRRLDVGIAMLHFEVGARLMGGMGIWRLLELPGVARYEPIPG